MASTDTRIGTAGWSIPSNASQAFTSGGTGLERYSAVFSCVEINSSFHRPHRASTWEKWRDSVPAAFRFSVKVPKAITHEARLVGTEKQVQAFLSEARLLREKLAVLLVQLPPSLGLDVEVPLPSSGTFVLRRWPASQLNRVTQAGSALKETPCCATWA